MERESRRKHLNTSERLGVAIHPACNTLCLFNMFRCKGLGEVSR